MDVKWHPITGRKGFVCSECDRHVYPLADTIFRKSETSLWNWFYAIFQFSVSKNGVSAKELERTLGVTYKTAWRMCDQIRKYMSQLDSDDPIGGVGEIVEIDETFVGGVVRGKGQGPHLENKSVVLGMLEKGGELITRVVPNRREHHTRPLIKNYVLPGSNVHTDFGASFQNLGECGYRHERVNHKIHEYVGTSGCTVNRIEGFWAMLKRGIYGTHIHVSGKHLPKYLGEFEYRWNMRHCPQLMLDRLMHSFSR
jgi:transposase-like protein